MNPRDLFKILYLIKTVLKIIKGNRNEKKTDEPEGEL